ncbi:CRISPR-associated protein, Ecoli subtype [Erwinia amylovora Ea644]|uniref:type I-E CRISPR-associated protein Cas5/CasD n=1 Tax=Erwinia amylovora TaxID=552 RepID=UPI0002C9F43D|nr:type I-E CRISPR-associated protein Cas5/CasD [Erwinia amylovora]CCP01682.1 CRISPR-associated protein, Ecoli subtype [Erwinia amylovora Ea644]CCP05677.1 CRISPR-associated protein, Ecoli subtype [Erwinia amylovora MR1]
MTDYLIMRLCGPMQAWGLPGFEATRSSASFPTRSGLLGLLGACLGIPRSDRSALQKLADSVRFAVRCDDDSPYKAVSRVDFHTVQDARKEHGSLKSNDTILTWREYLYDAAFTVALWTPAADQQGYTLEQLKLALQKPVFTPYLGRRSCPLSQPLFYAQHQAEHAGQALREASPGQGVIYSETAISGNERRLTMRDEPLIHLPRQFASRTWYAIAGDQ